MSLGRFVPLEHFVLGRFVCAPPGATRHSWKKKFLQLSTVSYGLPPVCTPFQFYSINQPKSIRGTFSSDEYWSGKFEK